MAEEGRLRGHVGTRMLYEDDRTRVWLLELAPGESTEWHEHECDYVFVVTQPGQARCEYVDGTVEVQSGDALGSTQYRKLDVGHRLVNTGTDVYQNIIVELKATTPA